jgi:hypothetical protein
MSAKSMSLPAPAHTGMIAALMSGLRAWLLAVGMGQDGPAGQLPEDIQARLG